MFEPRFGWLKPEVLILYQASSYPIYTDGVSLEIFPRHSCTLPVESKSHRRNGCARKSVVIQCQIETCTYISGVSGLPNLLVATMCKTEHQGQRSLLVKMEVPGPS